MRILFGLVLSYIIAAPLTERISFDLRLTHWADIMTYVFWLCGGLIWFGIGALAVFIFLAVKEFIR